MNKIIMQSGLFLDKIAYFEDEKLKKLKIINKNQKYFEKDIFIAKKKKKNVGMKSLTLALDDETTGFMHYFSDDTSEYQLCQIKKIYANEKNPKLTDEITLVGKYVIYIGHSSGLAISNKIKEISIIDEIHEKIDDDILKKAKIIVRSGVGVDDVSSILEEIKQLHAKYEDLEQKSRLISKPQLLYRQFNSLELFLSKINKKIDTIIVNDKEISNKIKKSSFEIDECIYESLDVFDKYGVSMEISSLLQDKVLVEKGINIYVQTTEAMNIIDVNSAGYMKYKDKNKNAYYINELVCEEIARQIELRDLSGIILIDFIEMKDEKLSKKLIEHMQKILEKDERKATISSMNKSNLMQIIRKKEDLSLSENIKAQSIDLYNVDYIFEQVNEKIGMIYDDDMKNLEIKIPIFEDVCSKDCVAKLEEKYDIKVNANYIKKSDFNIKIKNL